MSSDALSGWPAGDDKENDSRTATAVATQAAIQRRRKPKRRSTGVVQFDVEVRPSPSPSLVPSVWRALRLCGPVDGLAAIASFAATESPSLPLCLLRHAASCIASAASVLFPSMCRMYSDLCVCVTGVYNVC